MKKRIFSLMATALIVISILGGCAKEEKALVTENGEAEELSVMLWDRGLDMAPGTTTTDNALSKFIQDEVLASKNVIVKYVAVPRGQSDDKVNAMMAGANAPDIILTYDREMFSNFASKNGLADLTQALEDHGDTIKKELGQDILDVGIFDGKQFAIPANRGLQRARHLGYIRKDWLDALGIPIPTTTAELEAALYAFKENDPGNVGDRLVPWAMGGNPNAEKYFQTFVISFIDGVFENENIWTYQENHAVFHPQAKDGFEKLNQFYNDGIIAKDFAVDTNDDKYKQDISNGYAGFIIDDNTRGLDSGWFGVCKENVPTSEWIPVNCFTGNGTEYQGNVSNTVHGLYIMVPKESEDKVEPAIKFIDWLADVDNTVKVEYTPLYTTDENGLPIGLTTEEKLANEFPLITADYSLVTRYLTNALGFDKLVKVYTTMGWSGDFSEEYYEQVVTAVLKDLYVYPVFPQIMPDSATYGKTVSDLLVPFGYKTISAPTADFESTYAAEMEKVNQAGFDKILEEKRNYYKATIE